MSILLYIILFFRISMITILKHFHIKYVTNIRSQTGLCGGELCLCYETSKRRCESEQAQTYGVSRITCLETLLHQFSSNMLQSYMNTSLRLFVTLFWGFPLKAAYLRCVIKAYKEDPLVRNLFKCVYK